MRLSVSASLTCLAGLTVAASTAIAQPQTPAAPDPGAVAKAEQILVEARKALGGEKLSAVKTVVATGRTRRVRGNNLVPIEFEILIEFPDKYLRVDEFPAEDADPTSSGFTGDSLIQVPPMPAGPMPGRGGPGEGAKPPPAGGPPGVAPPGPGPGRAGPAAAPPVPAPEGQRGAAPAGAPPAEPAGARGGPPVTAPAPGAAPPMPAGGRGPGIDPRRARTLSLKQDYARLALGLFGASSAYPLTFAYAALAEAPQGKADVLDVKGEGNFTLRYFIDTKTRLPIMVTWTTPPTNVIVTVPGQPPPKTVAPGAVVVTGPPAPAANAPKEESDKYSKEVLALRAKAQATPVEHRLYFADYREVEGLRLPFRLRRAIGTETTEETTFDRFRLNARIDPRKFEAAK